MRKKKEITGASLLALLAKRIKPDGTPSEQFAVAQQMRGALLRALESPNPQEPQEPHDPR